ncbi:hypothetical protein HA402_013610 [Bradysia odoriphaga]|nr:hypothetical protein HA402_013610 [Bradysia odoriphaga]
MENQSQAPGPMKQSVSMTSLPPPGPQEVSDMAVAKMRLERPYNSLKKKRNSERDIWRNSWGSGHSHASSCSIHSTATNGGGSGIGKDDFWAALQPNYNYIMDTNLLDSCREARCEFEGASAAAACVEENCCEKSMSPSTRTQNLVGDPRRLRRWLREMENEMTKAPSISTASKMKSTELKRRLNEHSCKGFAIVCIQINILTLIPYSTNDRLTVLSHW